MLFISTPAEGIILWITLPSTGNPTGCIYDTTGTRDIHELRTLRTRVIAFNPFYPIVIDSVSIAGMEGDSIGISFFGLEGHMGIISVDVRNTVGWSCPHSYVYAIPQNAPPDSTPIPTPSDTLTGEYYIGTGLTQLYDVRYDPNINFWWNYGSPMIGMPVDDFSVRWTGKLHPTEGSGTYRLCMEVCNGSWNFWLAESQFSSWNGTGCNEICKPVGLTFGDSYDVKIDVTHTINQAAARLRWLTPNGKDQYIPPEAWQ